jgi:2-iminobutanoate/2-iminopropanoate deaminase
MVGKDVSVQTERAFENLKAALEAAGSALSQVARCDALLKDINDFKIMNEVYGSKFVTEPKPTREVVRVGAATT